MDSGKLDWRAFKIPRTELDRCKERDELKQSGVYYLFGDSDKIGGNAVYIGQAGTRKNGEGILYRLLEHKRHPDKDYWTEAVVFTTSNISFGPTEISYLESRFYRIAMEAKRCKVANANNPTSGNITEEKESELEEFIENAKILMGELGHIMFDSISAMEPSNTDKETILYLKTKKTDATGRRTSEGFVVFKYSSLSTQKTRNCPTSIKYLREQYAERISDDGQLLENTLIRSPSAAAGFVTFSSSNGLTIWKTKEGATLALVENSDQ